MVTFNVSHIDRLVFEILTTCTSKSFSLRFIVNQFRKTKLLRSRHKDVYTNVSGKNDTRNKNVLRSVRRLDPKVQFFRFFFFADSRSSCQRRRVLSKASRVSLAPPDAYTSRAGKCSRSSCCRDCSTGTYTWALCRTRT